MATRNATHQQPTAPRSPDPRAITADDVEDGRENTHRTFTDDTIGEVMIGDGYGVMVRVQQGALEVIDGIGEYRRTRWITRAQAAAGGVRRVLILGHGTVTTDAAGWCANLGTALIVAGPTANPLLIGAPQLYGHGALRRAQALAAYTDTGLQITRTLLHRRLGDQARITRDLINREDRAAAIDELGASLDTATDQAALMVIEMHAAEHYWTAWADELRLGFLPKDKARIPGHWTAFGARTSPLNEAPSNRHAATPACSLLNYGYRLAEIEATIASLALGLDPAMGLAHADRTNRPAFALDLMEPLRAIVEETVWTLSTDRRFRKADFAEQPDGEIRLLAPLTHDYAKALLPALRAVCSPIAEEIARRLGADAPDPLQVPTVLSRSAHKAGRARKGAQVHVRRSRPSPAAQLYACPGCGAPVSNPRHVRCPSCRADDPAHSEHVRSVRGRAIAASKRAQKAWEHGGGDGAFDPATWPEIHAGLASVKLAEIVAATGLSKGSASRIRAGHSRPHPSHWAALAKLTAVKLRQP